MVIVTLAALIETSSIVAFVIVELFVSPSIVFTLPADNSKVTRSPFLNVFIVAGEPSYFIEISPAAIYCVSESYVPSLFFGIIDIFKTPFKSVYPENLPFTVWSGILVSTSTYLSESFIYVNTALTP